MPEIDWKAYNQRVELQRQMMEEEAKKNAWKNRLLTMGMGFGMGMFVGGSVVVLHHITNKLPRQNMLRNAAGAGASFGVIFAVGSLIRPS